jgi:ProP effector
MSQSRREATLDFLIERFPKCFNLDNPRPLKVGIAFDIMAGAPPEISWLAITLALDGFTKARSYLERVVVGEQRIDLAGQSAGTVTADEAAYAAKRLARVARAEQKAAKASAPPSVQPPPPRRGDSFEGLRQAARARRK